MPPQNDPDFPDKFQAIFGVPKTSPSAPASPPVYTDRLQEALTQTFPEDTQPVIVPVEPSRAVAEEIPPVVSGDFLITPPEVPGVFAPPFQTESAPIFGIEHTLHGEDEIFAPAPLPRRKTHWLRKLAFACFIAFLGMNVAGVALLGSGFYAAKQDVDRMFESVSALQIDDAVEDLAAVRDDFARARNGAYLLQWARPIPWVGDQIEGAGTLLVVAVQTLDVLEQAGTLAQDLYHIVTDAEIIADDGTIVTDITFEDIPDRTKEELFRTLALASPDLYELRSKVHLAQTRMTSLDRLSVHPLLASGSEELNSILVQLSQGIDFLVPFASTVGELAGVGEDRQWLVLFLNNTELRPGGGFIGVYGLLTMRDGSIVNMVTDDSYAIDKLVEGNPAYSVTPPKPFQEYMILKNWYFRDSNWSPDFPSSSENVVRMMQNEFKVAGQPSPAIDGVIGFTPDLAEDMLGIIGPVTVDGFTFTHDNVTAQLEELVEFYYAGIGVPKEERKEIVGDLTDAVLAKVLASDLDVWQEILVMIETKFREKHIALYSFDEKTQTAFDDFGWAGSVDSGVGDDKLMLVDANIAALKTDLVVDRKIDYAITKEGSDYEGHATVTYTNTGTYTKTTGMYRTFMRLYVPKGSEFLSYDGDVFGMEIEEDLGLLSIGGYIEVKPGQTASVTYHYRLPESVNEAVQNGVYQLAVWKQMGSKNHALTLDLDFGKNIRTALPAEEKENWGNTQYEITTTIPENLLFTVEFN